MQHNCALPEFLTNPNPEVYLSDDYVVFDFETTIGDNGSALQKANRFLLVTWICGGDRKRALSGVRVQHATDLVGLASLFEALDRAKFVVAHNAKFDLQWLARLGYDIGKLVVYDTMLGEYVRLGNRQGRKDLDTVLSRYGIARKRPLVKVLLHAGVCPSEIPAGWLLEYGKWDTEATNEAFLRQREELHRGGLLAVLYTRCLATVVLADMETYGVKPDEPLVREEFARESLRRSLLDSELARTTGGINLRSSKQVAGYLYDTLRFDEPVDKHGKPSRNPGGGRLTDAETITKLHATTPEQREFQELYREYRKVDKRTEILTKLLAACEDRDGLLYAQFNQAVTQTHRLSSSGRRHKLQFQNFPRDYKRLFKARFAGWLVGEADGAQLEFRVAVHLGRDLVGGRDIRAGFDVHRFTASALYLVAIEGVTKEQRQNAKPETFRPLYGGQGYDEKTKRYARAFRERWKGISDTQKGWTYEVLRTKCLRTESGLIFYWPDTRITDSGYTTNTTSIYNYPVQSFATAEIIPIALVFFWHRLRAAEAKSFLVNTIHDSIIGEVHPDEQELFKEIARKSLTYDTFDYLQKCYKVTFTVPLGCETKIGSHWGEGKGEAFDLDPERL